MKFIKFSIIFFNFFVFSIGYSQDVAKEIAEFNSNLRKQNYYSASISGLKAIDKLLFFLEKTILDSIVDLKDYRLVSTNTFSRIVMEKGNYDLELFSQKVFSNNICILTVTLDAAEDAFERNYSLYLSYDYLSEKKNFKKFELTNKSVRIPIIAESDTLIMIYFTEDKEPQKGFIAKMEYSFFTKMSSEKKWDLILKDITEISSGINRTRLKTFLK